LFSIGVKLISGY